MNTAYLLTGSNMGDRINYLQQAIELIEAANCTIINRSAVYETAAWGKIDQNAFLNQALAVETSLSAPELMALLLRIEEKVGRKRVEKYGPRIIDLDMLLFNNDILQTPELNVPHPELPNRRFALVPLAEIAGDVKHPVLHKTIKELLAECKDPLPVKKFA